MKTTEFSGWEIWFLDQDSSLRLLKYEEEWKSLHYVQYIYTCPYAELIKHYAMKTWTL
jgi:hypothetical protein